MAEKEFDSGAIAPPGRDDGFFSLRKVTTDFEISSDEPSSTVTYSDVSVRNGDGRQWSTTWNLGVTVPVGGKDDVTAKSIDSLANGFKVSASLSLFSFRSVADALARLEPEAHRACEAVEHVGKGQAPCNFRLEEDKTRKYLSDEYVDRKELYTRSLRIGVSGAVGFDRFDYIDPASLGENHATKPQFKIGLFTNLYPADNVSVLVANVEYQNAFEANDATVLCLTPASDPGKDCKHGVPGAPHNVEHANLSLEYRRALRLGGWQLGLAPRGEIDAVSGEWSAEFPLYYIPKDGRTLPGVKVDYSSKKDSWDVSLFVRSKFSL